MSSRETTIKVDQDLVKKIEELRKELGLNKYSDVIDIAIRLLEIVLECVEPEFLTKPGYASYREILSKFEIACTVKKLARLICWSYAYNEDEFEECKFKIFKKLFLCKNDEEFAIELESILRKYRQYINDETLTRINKLLETIRFTVEKKDQEIIVKKK